MRKKRLAMNTASSLVFQITAILCGFVLPRLMLKAYGSEANGLVASITQFFGVITFLEMGLGAVIQSSLYKPLADHDEEQISKIMVSVQRFFSKIAKILLIYVVVLTLFYPVIAEQNYGFLYTASMIAILSISSFMQYYFGIVNKLLLGADQRGYISYNVQTITLLLNTLGCYILIELGAGIHLVKLTTSLIYAMRPLALSAYVKKNYQIDWKIRYEKEPIKQKWNGVAQHISSAVLSGTDSIVLTIFAGLKEVSVYSVYYMVVNSINQLLLSITDEAQSLIGELWAKRELDELKQFFGWVEWANHTGTVLVFGAASILILPFVQVYTKGVSDTNYAHPAFAVLIVAANAGYCLRRPYHIMIRASGSYKQTQSNYMIAAVMNIVISVLTVSAWGLIGVVIGTLAAMFYQTIWMAWYDSKHLIQFPLKNFIRQVGVDVVSVIAMYGIINLPFAAPFFQMQEISYGAWVALAVKVSFVACLCSLCVNWVFYRKYILWMIEKLKKFFPTFT